MILAALCLLVKKEAPANTTHNVRLRTQQTSVVRTYQDTAHDVEKAR